MSVDLNASVADRMAAHISYRRMCRAGFQPADAVQEAIAKSQEDLKAYGEQLLKSIQSQQKEAFEPIESAVAISEENALKANEEQMEALKKTHAQFQKIQGTLLKKLEDSETALQEIHRHKILLKSHLDKLTAAATTSHSTQSEQCVRQLGAKVCETISSGGK